ncbi:MAG: Bax inhibitor-1/YccA family protein [Gammaproteobacteria bacterium]|nr:Bax inhibitor-1/YccA family protein [Gammaproteobacteria bacterium]MXW51918.1 Bax inhibitor-1/YccA family protein [Gammaproteobacteria bacterium]MXX29312.1 Bax inhibitor-1/YccA family protein [Gammaproteobacteria bacterium]MXY06897.1 Bax inhibitor-1/YccA family protein [Gammaproteobacteria bacterium]MYE52934.1 Bax inhibitor-1/YccA family protein [Gammaproteobacteria bacterium]
MAPTDVISARAAGAVSINKVLRNTYMLLGMTLAFSALMAGVSMAMGAPYLGPIVTLVGFFGLIFAVHKTADSSLGLLFTFLLTGFMGFTIGPIINAYLSLANGPSLVTSALGTTAAAFVGLSAFAVITRKDFSFLSGFLVVGFFVLMGAVVLSLFFDLSAFSVAISSAFVLFASAAILWQTSAIIHGGETNYIIATVTLFASFYNLFVSLLHIFGVMGDE